MHLRHLHYLSMMYFSSYNKKVVEKKRQEYQSLLVVTNNGLRLWKLWHVFENPHVRAVLESHTAPLAILKKQQSSQVHLHCSNCRELEHSPNLQDLAPVASHILTILGRKINLCWPYWYPAHRCISTPHGRRRMSCSSVSWGSVCSLELLLPEEKNTKTSCSQHSLPGLSSQLSSGQRAKRCFANHFWDMLVGFFFLNHLKLCPQGWCKRDNEVHIQT